jgi:hypothetical protein
LSTGAQCLIYPVRPPFSLAYRSYLDAIASGAQNGQLSSFRLFIVA